MRALTLHRPWAYAITHLGKRIENRTWAPWNEVIGGQIAIHSGLAIDAAGLQWMVREGLAKLPLPPESHVAGAVVALAIVEGFVRKSRDPWFCGPVGWVLRDVHVLRQPVKCRGAQSLWRVPTDIEAQIIRELPL